MRHGVAALAAVATLTAGFAAVEAQQQEGPQMPPDIQKIIDKMKSGQRPTPDEIQKLMEYGKRLRSRVHGTESQFAPKYDAKGHKSYHEGIPALVTATAHYVSTWREEVMTVDFDCTAKAALFAKVNGDGDWSTNVMNPDKPYSSFTFEPLAKDGKVVQWGAGSYSDRKTAPNWVWTKSGTVDFGQAGFMLVTTGKDALWPTPGGGVGARIQGTTTATGPGCHSVDPYHDDASGALDGLVPFAWENAQKITAGQPLPAPKMRLSYKDFVRAVASGKTETLRGNESFTIDREGQHIDGTTTLTIVLRPPEEKLVVEPVSDRDYREWLPVPVNEEKTFGKATPLRARAKIVAKRPGEDSPLTGIIDFRLKDVSKYPGKCGNYPLDGTPKDEDLRFADAQPPGIIRDDDQHVHTAEMVSEAEVLVEAKDSAAWGKLDAEVTALSLLSVCPRTGKNYLTVPQDDDENLIADWWEHSIDHSSGSATLDEDEKPADQLCDGDGLTRFEEYRGFVEIEPDGSWKHVRTSSHEKDVFCWDKSRFVHDDYFPENPAKLAWHFVDDHLMKFTGGKADPDNRWFNVNTPQDLRYARQYGMYVLRDDSFLDYAGGANPNPTNGYPFSIKNVYECRISVAAIDHQFQGAEKLKAYSGPDGAAKIQESEQNELKSTVIHEIGHYIGIHHHLVPGTKLEPDKKTGKIGWQEDSENGVLDCAMRNSNKRDIAAFQAGTPTPARTRYCRGGEQGVGADGKTPRPSDDCFGQIKAKSDP